MHYFIAYFILIQIGSKHKFIKPAKTFQKVIIPVFADRT